MHHVALMPAIKGRCTLQVLVTHSDYEKQYTLTPSSNHVAMSLCRNSKVAFARHSLNNGALRMQLLKKIEKSVKAEMKHRPYVYGEKYCSLKNSGI